MKVDLCPAIPAATMVAPMRIRRATLEDRDAILAMGQQFLTETVYRDRITANPDAMRQHVTHLLQGRQSAVFVSEAEHGLAGMLGLFIYAHQISGAPTAVETFWWTQPDARGHGLGLLREAERWAKGMGATAIQMIAPTDAVARLYERLHFRKLETTYMRSL